MLWHARQHCHWQLQDIKLIVVSQLIIATRPCTYRFRISSQLSSSFTLLPHHDAYVSHLLFFKDSASSKYCSYKSSFYSIVRHSILALLFSKRHRRPTSLLAIKVTLNPISPSAHEYGLFHDAFSSKSSFHSKKQVLKLNHCNRHPAWSECWVGTYLIVQTVLLGKQSKMKRLRPGYTFSLFGGQLMRNSSHVALSKCV